MHSHVRGSHRAKFDDDDFNSFRGIACEGRADRHTDRLGSSTLLFAKSLQTKQKYIQKTKQKRGFIRGMPLNKKRDKEYFQEIITKIEIY